MIGCSLKGWPGFLALAGLLLFLSTGVAQAGTLTVTANVGTSGSVTVQKATCGTASACSTGACTATSGWGPNTLTSVTRSVGGMNDNNGYIFNISAGAGYGIYSVDVQVSGGAGQSQVLTYAHASRTDPLYHDTGYFCFFVPNGASSLTINVNLKPRYKLTTSVTTAAASGTVSPAGDYYMLQGESTVVNATATAHYGVQTVLINDAPQSVASYPATFQVSVPNITGNTTVKVGFAYVWTITASIGGQTGTIAPMDAVTVAQGANKSFTVTAAAGSKILDVVIDGATSMGRQTSPYTYTFTNVSGDHTIRAVFTTPAVNITNYCDRPAFLSDTLKPNLLLMLDNSASMYDLANTNTSATTYCYDNSYNDNGTYIGYFKYEGNAGYRYNFGSGEFDEGSNPGSCTYSTDYFCVSTQGGAANGAVTAFWAKGNFLNWLTASKIDQLKWILTGGKYDTISHVLIPESRGCLGRRYVKDIPTAHWVTRPTGGNITFGVRGPNGFDVDYVTKSTQGGKTRIEIFPGTYDFTHCNGAVQEWQDATSQGVVQAGGTGSNTALCLGADTNLKSTAYNHATHLCYRVLTGGSNGSAELQPLKSDCQAIYSNFYQNNPGNITNETAGDAICASTLWHNLNNGNESGYIGRCWTGGTWDPTLNSGAGGWVGGVLPSWDDACVATEVQDFCTGAHTFDVTDPSDAAAIPNTTLITPSFIIDAGLASLGSPIATMLAHVSVDQPPTGLINQFADLIDFGTIQHNWNGVGDAAAGSSAVECGGTSAIQCAKACWHPARTENGVAKPAGFEDPVKDCYIDSDCPGGDSCIDVPKRDGGVVSSYIGLPLGGHAVDNTVIGNIDKIQANSWTPLAETFYNAIGYYGRRSDLRLNSADFDLDPAHAAGVDPTTYVCKDNYVLVLSDGGSTADENSAVNSLATTYAISGGQTGVCANAWKGSANLDELVNLAFTKNIRTFSKTDPSSSEAPVNKNEKIITYVVNTGKAATGTDQCLSGPAMLDAAAAKGGTGYTAAFLANRASDLKTTLNDIFWQISSRITSGTAASILSNSEGSGANLLQAIFYPQKTFNKLSNVRVNWIGELQDFWYYIDPFIGRSTVREDTTQDGAMNLTQDYVAQFVFNTHTAQTEVYLSKDTDGNGLGDNATPADVNPPTPARISYSPNAVVSADQVRSLWRAGRKLWLRSPDDRQIFTQLDGAALTSFTGTALGTSSASVQALFQATSELETNNIINYIRGEDQDQYRNRKVSIPGLNSGVASEWKLGDIISSTPRVQSANKLNGYQLSPPVGYSDVSYDMFSTTSDYRNRGMAYVGANDGMLHAFKAGKLQVATSGDQKATLSAGTQGVLGKEEWAFIPKNAIPYLTYLTDPGIGEKHLYYVDGTPAVFDASINTCGTGQYYDCPKDKTGGTNWKTVLIGSMGLGGASKNTGTSTTDYPHSVTTPIANTGYSSYFALDITNQTFDATTGVRNTANLPTFKWEFSHPDMGYATSGPAIVRIASTTSGHTDNDKNGHWFAVFASGPTGPIDGSACQFKGKSDQPLKIFVVDLNARAPWVEGTNFWIIDPDPAIPFAFGGSISGGVIDADRWNRFSSGFYSDDAVYVGYVRADNGTQAGPWNQGGVLRLLTHEDPNPAHWTLAKVIDGIGAVTSNISRLQDRQNKNLWLYFGSGRYFYNQDDMASGRKIFGVKEPCYQADNTIRKSCGPDDEIGISSLTNQSGLNGDTVSDSLSVLGSKGWYISLDDKDDSNQLGAERSVTDPVAMTNGAVFFTTYKPTGDPCKFGGRSRMWGVKYDTGYKVPPPALQGKALVQISTGEFKEIDLSTAFTSRQFRAMGEEMTGKPPGDPPPIVTKANLKPVKKILHIQEH